MPDTFPLLDLPSQALAVEHLLSGRPEAEKMAWLEAHGKLEAFGPSFEGRTFYVFESVIGLRCGFLIKGEKFLFLADHSFYTVGHPGTTANSRR